MQVLNQFRVISKINFPPPKKKKQRTFDKNKILFRVQILSKTCVGYCFASLKALKDCLLYNLTYKQKLFQGVFERERKKKDHACVQYPGFKFWVMLLVIWLVYSVVIWWGVFSSYFKKNETNNLFHLVCVAENNFTPRWSLSGRWRFSNQHVTICVQWCRRRLYWS